MNPNLPGPSATHITPLVGGREKLTSQEPNIPKVLLYLYFKAEDVRYYRICFALLIQKREKNHVLPIIVRWIGELRCRESPEDERNLSRPRLGCGKGTWQF